MKGKYIETKIAGKSYPVAFNKYALGKFCRSQGLTLNDLTSGQVEEDLETFLNLAYYGLVGGAAAKYGKEFSLNYIQTCMLFEEDETALERIMEIWGEQLPADQPEEKKAKPKGKSSPGTK